MIVYGRADVLNHQWAEVQLTATDEAVIGLVVENSPSPSIWVVILTSSNVAGKWPANVIIRSRVCQFQLPSPRAIIVHSLPAHMGLETGTYQTSLASRLLNWPIMTMTMTMTTT